MGPELRTTPSLHPTVTSVVQSCLLKGLPMSERTKVGLVVTTLILIVVGWNFVANGAAEVFKPKKKTEDKTQAEHKEKTPAELLGGTSVSMGPKDAPVQILVLLGMQNSCHSDSVKIFTDIFREYRGQVRVVFKDMNSPDAAKLADASKMGCELGILINGRSAYKLPGRGIVTFIGPANMGKDYTLPDLYKVIDMIIERKTGAKPIRYKYESKEGKSAEKTSASTSADTSSEASPSSAKTSSDTE